jgi:hypothetical protein
MTWKVIPSIGRIAYDVCCIIIERQYEQFFEVHVMTVITTFLFNQTQPSHPHYSN